MRRKKCPDFRRAAAQRLTTAEFLLDNEYYLDSMYLGGYVVECALKALILARTPRNQRQQKCTIISRGTRGHDFEYLRAELKAAKCPVPPQIVLLLGRVAEWSTEWRYAVGLGQYRRAKEFFDAVQEIRNWTERSL
jgi:HEPN domain